MPRSIHTLNVNPIIIRKFVQTMLSGFVICTVMTDPSSLESHLSRYLPAESVSSVAAILIQYRAKLKVTRSRFTKLADYRPPQNGAGHLITINHDLNPFEFLITVIHEFAHLTTHLRHDRKVRSHGKEWQKEFRLLLYPFLHKHIFPDDILDALDHHLKKPSASSCADEQLQRILKKYDKGVSEKRFVEDVPEGVVFELRNGLRLRKEAKLRKRFRCKEMGTGKIFLVSGLAEVVYSDPVVF